LGIRRPALLQSLLDEEATLRVLSSGSVW
jgi:hypothetical protein